MTEKNEQKVGLAACPFCGFDKPRLRDNHGDAYWVECPVCDAEVAGFDTPVEAAAAWNRRTPPLDALRALEQGWRADAVCARKRAAAASSNKRRLQELGSADTYETTASELAAIIKAMGGENG